MILRSLVGALALAFLVLPAQARHVHHRRHHHAARMVEYPVSSPCAGTIYDNDGRVRCAGGGRSVFPNPWEGRGRVRHLALVRHGHSGNNAPRTSWRGGYARVCVGSHCGTVAAAWEENFRGLFAEFLALGYDIGHPGCLSAGHMRHSLHHSGRACDLFDQVARNRTALRQPPPTVQIEVARRHGLTAGCIWRNPDCGHFDVSGAGGYAMARLRRSRIVLRR